MTNANVVVCPDCGHENLRGEETCSDCSAPLVQLDKSPDRSGKSSISRDRIGSLPLSHPRALDKSDKVSNALEAMKGQVDACVVVLDGKKTVGIVTERDLLYKVAGRADAAQRTLGEIMTPDPVRVYTDDRVSAAFNKMAVGGFRHLPVFDGEQLMGVLTVSVLLEYLRVHHPTVGR